MNEQLKILEMIEKGQITAVEGLELLEALNTAKDTETVLQVQTPPAVLRHNFKYLKIRVTADNNSVNVNVNVPIRLLTTIGEIAGRMTTMIPVDAQRDMARKGIDISNIDFAKIIDELINGTLDDPDIVDVEAWDEEHICFFVPDGQIKNTPYSIHSLKAMVQMAIRLSGSLTGEEPYELVDITAQHVRVSIQIR